MRDGTSAPQLAGRLVTRRNALKLAALTVGAGIVSTQLPGSVRAREGSVAGPAGINACLDNAGKRHIFGLSADGKLQWLTDESGSWQAQDISAGAGRTGIPAITNRPDKDRLDVFASSADGQTWARTRTGTNVWSAWVRVGANASAHGFDGVLDSTNAHHIVGVSSTGGIWKWYGWLGDSFALQDVTNGGTLVAAPAATYFDGWLDIFGVGTDGAVYRQRNESGSSIWSGWSRVGGSNLVGLSAERSANGTFTVVGTNSSGKLTRLLSTDGSQWSTSDISYGGTAVGRPAILATGTGLDVLVVGTDGQAWMQSLTGSSTSGWRAIGGSFGRSGSGPVATATVTATATPAPSGTPGPISFKSLADARANLNLPAGAEFYMWPTNRPGIMLEEVFMGMSENQILVLPERAEPYYIDSADGFRAAGIEWIQNGSDGPTISIVNEYKGKPARTWFAMARARKGILGLGPGAVIQPSQSSFSRPPQAYPGLVADTGWEMVGCNDKLIETVTANAYFGNFTIRSRDFGGMAYKGITANNGVTYENLDFDAAFRAFSTEPNGEAGALNANGPYLMRNVRVKATDSSGKKIGTTGVMINSSGSGKMENVHILDSSGPAWWNCSGTHEAVNLYVGAGAPNFEAAKAGFAMNWTGGRIVATKKVHISLRSPFGSQKITWRGVELKGNAPSGSLYIQQYGAGASEARTQREADLKCFDVAGRSIPIVLNKG